MDERQALVVWLNSILAPRFLSVTDVPTNLSDGLLLGHLVELLTEHKVLDRSKITVPALSYEVIILCHYRVSSTFHLQFFHAVFVLFACRVRHRHKCMTMRECTNTRMRMLSCRCADASRRK
jgi:hypothetical protein